jgi:hypothetical protein
MGEPKPCSHCGKLATDFWTDRKGRDFELQVICEECLSRGPLVIVPWKEVYPAGPIPDKYYQQAIAAWNRRRGPVKDEAV